MYIPSTFFSSQGACISASVSSITGSGLITTGTFVSNSVLYQYYQFEMTDAEAAGLTAFTASLNILSGSTGQAKILIVGAGGSSGRRQVTWCPDAFCYTNDYCGGAGAGGVVYYDNFPLSSGSYEIGVGNATPSVSDAYGFNGDNSYIKLPNNRTYTPFSNSYITAYGGGSGGTYGSYRQLSPPRTFYNTIPGGNGGSGGGMGSAINGAAGGGGGGGNPNGGLNGQVQGYAGGSSIYGNPGGSTGGGGAGSPGVTQYLDPNTGQIQYFTDGGDGVTYNLTGTPTIYASGGPGAARNFKPGYYGRGGNPGGLTTNGTNGYGGVVIITWPICLADSDNCKEYVIRGGASGGTMTYIPCDTQTITTTTIDFGYTGSACLYNVAGYPTTTGTVTLTQTGSCNNFIPIPPTVTCTTGSKTAVNLYNWNIPGQCYPTPSSCQRLFYPTQTVNYVDTNGVSQSAAVGGWFTGTGQLCARNEPTPTISAGTISNSGLICGFYCSSSTTTTTTTTTTSTTTTTTTTLPPTNISCSFQFVAMGSPGTWSYTDCNGNVTASIYPTGYTSSVSPTSLICVSASAGLTGQNNQLFQSPYNCSYTSSQTTTQQITFRPNINYNYSLASWIPSGSTNYVFRIIPYSQSFGPVCTLSGSAYRSSGANVRFERLSMITGSLNC